MSAKTLMFLLLAGVAVAQSPRFEVASVRVNTAERGQGLFGGVMSRITHNGDVEFQRIDIFSLILRAYEIGQNREAVTKLEADPKFRELMGTTVDVQAKGGTGTVPAKLRTLLADGFGFKAHTETRTVPMWALKVKQPGRLGPFLKPSSVNCREWAAQRERPADAKRPEPCTFRSRVLRGAGTIGDLLDATAPLSMREPIIDQTGLTGNFEWELAFGREGSNAPTFFDAFEDQLGLKLEKTTGPWEVLVIDNVRMPTEN